MEQEYPHYNGSMVQRVENGAWALLPYLMPESVNEAGEAENQGRYCIAYSRDGWWVIDSESMTALRWCPSEQNAIRERESILYRAGITV